MDRVKIHDQVIEKISKIMIDNSTKISEDSYFMEDLDISSIEVMELISDLESEYKITIPEEKMYQFIQVKDLVNYLYEVLGEKSDEK